MALSWWAALAVLVITAPWPGWHPGPLVVLAAATLGLGAARPRGRALWAWAMLAPAIVAALDVAAPQPSETELASGFSRHAIAMRSDAETLVTTPRLQQLVTAAGEALDPSEPFRILETAARGRPGRTVYLADDRGRLVAWSGASRAYPFEERPLGMRRWSLSWSTREAVLTLREPILVDGRLAGAISVADATPLTADAMWGMGGGRGWQLCLGHDANAVSVTSPDVPGLHVPVVVEEVDRLRPLSGWTAAAWGVFLVAALTAAPAVGMAACAAATAAVVAGPGPSTLEIVAVLILAWGAAVGRVGSRLPPAAARWMVSVAAAVGAASTLAVRHPALASWLPDHLLRPGWGVVWVLAAAWALSAWPSLRRTSPLTLGLALVLAAGVAVVGLGLALIRIPLELVDAAQGLAEEGPGPGALDVESLMPAPAADVDVADLAVALAERWGLGRRVVPTQLRLVGPGDAEWSRWGDLSGVGATDVERRWSLAGWPGLALVLRSATGPWRWLGDWRDTPAGAAGGARVAVFTRAGAVAATFHEEIRALAPEVAGRLFHAETGWALVRVGESLQPARVVRHGDWLVATVARSPAAAVWALKTAMASIWGLLGLLLVRPPGFDRDQLTTFGGRLRMLVAVGVVLPLVILTLFLHLRLVSEERRLEQVFGLEGLRSARYTTVYLAGGVPADDDLARWLATGWGGEAALFDGAEVTAVSRPDLMQTGVLPELPAEEAYISYLLGRDDTIVVREPERLVAAGPVQLEDRRLLLQLYRVDPVRAREGPGAVDWLLTGAVLAALVVLVVTGRIEQRLSASLRNLVRLADTLLRGEPPGDVARPPETDLAGVLDAVRSMHEEVRRREASLRHQEELLRVTLSTLAPAVMVLETDGTVRFANPAAERLLEAERSMVLACVRETAGDDRPGGDAAVRTVSPRPGEETRWRVGVADAPLPDGRRGLIAVVDDVTDLVQADRLRQLNQLARIVAHEVKNPLTPIRLWVQELDEARRRSEPLDALVDEASREISSQVDRLQETANSFSNLVALEQWTPETVDLVALTDEVVRGFAVVERRGVRLERDAPEAPVPVTGDRQWLRRAVSNLLRNSLDAIGDTPGSVHLSVRAEDGTAVLEVADSGGGVPDDQLLELFEPHFSTTSGGSGLGLALVRHIAARCHGRVTATNGRDGLIVRLELPLLR